MADSYGGRMQGAHASVQAAENGPGGESSISVRCEEWLIPVGCGETQAATSMLRAGARVARHLSPGRAFECRRVLGLWDQVGNVRVRTTGS